MLYRAHQPAPPLDAFVDYLWYVSDAPRHSRERILPSGTVELVVNLARDEIRVIDPRTRRLRRLSGALVSGTYREAFIIDTEAHASMIGVHFKPGGAGLLGVPAGSLADDHVELAALWGADAAWLRERLCGATSLDARFDILEHALLARLRHARPRHPATQFAIAELDGTGRSIASVVEELGLSHRRLIEVFTADVGVAPKLFGRLRRFQRAWALGSASATPAWSRLAVQTGYSDQSHLIREFVAFAGAPPGELYRQSDVDVKEHHVAVA
ncbi:MAG: AraC family transcriptional regulator [Kofleriaceae bacterium]|nr:AraC family transcriptional regulator [Kofleriaceae bacterium]